MAENKRTGRQNRTSILDELSSHVQNAGADEHSPITQIDKAFTPGSDKPLLALAGTTNIPRQLGPDIAAALAGAIADRHIDIEGLDVEGMEFDAQQAVAFMLVANSVEGQGWQEKAQVMSGPGPAPQKGSGFWRKKKGYDGFGDDE